jgi:type I restriction enzyme R subunit
MTPPSGYTEDALIERSAIALLAELGWQTVNAYHEFDHGASSLGRETKDEVVLKSRLREALLKLNPEASPEAVHQAIEELTRDRSRMSAAGRPIARSTASSRTACAFPGPIPKATARRWRW